MKTPFDTIEPKKFYWLLFLLFSLLSGTMAQVNKHMLGEKQGISLSVLLNKTPKQSITRLYENTDGADLSSRSLLAFEGRLRYHRFLKQKIEFELGFSFGFYPYDTRFFIADTFSEVGHDIEHYSFGYDGFYAGLNAGIQYYFKLNDRRFISIGPAISLVYFPYFYITEGFNVTLNADNAIRVYDSTISINADRKPFIAPEISFRFHQKLGQRLLLQLSFIGVFSNGKPFVGVFTFIGAKERLEGSYTKRFAYAGVDATLKLFLGKRNVHK